jgi:hypothetical protein
MDRNACSHNPTAAFICSLKSAMTNPSSWCACMASQHLILSVAGIPSDAALILKGMLSTHESEWINMKERATDSSTQYSMCKRMLPQPTS